jgi:glycosyltransferase involved in cell wall biosynthesis
LNIFLHIRNNSVQWGGDLVVINGLAKGLAELGIEVSIGPNLQDGLNFKHIFLTNTCIDKRTEHAFLREKGRSFAMLTFHEDFLKYFPSAIGFVKCLDPIIKEGKIAEDNITLDALIENPSLCEYYGTPPIKNGVRNAQVLKECSVSFPSSYMEQATVLRDAPGAITKVLLNPIGLASEWKVSSGADFAASFNLRHPYILQVGRLETRKNQLATVIAAADIPVELVFICTKGYQPWYDKLVIDAILKYRKYPTLLVSEHLPTQQHGILRIVQMPNGKKLSSELLQSAYRGALVNAHPAFYELPGLTYLESVHCKIQTICSQWTSVSEYLENDAPGSGVYYIDPRSIRALKQAMVDSIYNPQDVTATTVNVTPKRYAERVVSSLLEYA